MQFLQFDLDHFPTIHMHVQMITNIFFFPMYDLFLAQNNTAKEQRTNCSGLSGSVRNGSWDVTQFNACDCDEFSLSNGVVVNGAYNGEINSVNATCIAANYAFGANVRFCVGYIGTVGGQDLIGLLVGDGVCGGFNIIIIIPIIPSIINANPITSNNTKYIGNILCFCFDDLMMIRMMTRRKKMHLLFSN